MFVFSGKRLHSSVLENHARFIFFPKPWTVFFLAKGGCLPLCRTMQGVCFLKTVQCFFVAKGIFVCKTMLFKIKEWFFFLGKRGNLLLCIPVHCLPSTLAQSNTVTVSECSHTPVVKVLEALRQLMDISVYLAESVWLCTFDDRA